MITEEMISKLEKELGQAKEVLSKAQQALNDALDEMARQYCPHKVGDTIDCGGYSYRGKKMIVDRIARTSHRSSYWPEKWRVFGRVLKKDGSIGQIFYDFEG